jgi:predicted metal-dependent phosphoesterase TrpH
MLKYLRNKVVSVDRLTPDELTVFGLLDDDLYGIQLEAIFSLDTLQIKKISGKWHRWTTPECPRALEHLESAIGFKVAQGFRHNIQKTLGRSGCRHFANLLVEMGHAAKNARMVILFENARKTNPELTIETFYSNPPPDLTIVSETQSPPVSVSEVHPDSVTEDAYIHQTVSRKNSNHFCMEIHVHSTPASPCSTIPVHQHIIDAKKMGLDGIVLTDHNHVWPEEQIQDLRKRFEFPVLGGTEITTDHGDILVYGFYDTIKGIIPLKELRKKVVNQGGFMAAAHPFRAFLLIGGHQLNTKVKTASQKQIFEYVDAIEIFNGKCSDSENQLAAEVAKYLGLKGIAGSDAHEAGSIGRFTTDFFEKVNTVSDFLEQLHAGSFAVSSLRQEG